MRGTNLLLAIEVEKRIKAGFLETVDYSVIELLILSRWLKRMVKCACVWIIEI